jgi:hypothetical protein
MAAHLSWNRMWLVGEKKIAGREFESFVGALCHCEQNQVVVCRIQDDSICVTEKNHLPELSSIGYKLVAKQ